MVMYIDRNYGSGLLEKWASTSLYIGRKMRDGLAIRIMDDIYEFMGIREQWNRLVASSESPDIYRAENLYDSWKKFMLHTDYSVHILLAYSGRKLIGGAVFFVHHYTLAGITIYRRLRLFNAASEDFAGRADHDGTQDIVAAKGFESQVAESLASYLTDTLHYWDEVEFGNADPLGKLVKQVLPLLRNEASVLGAGSAVHPKRRGIRLHAAEISNHLAKDIAACGRFVRDLSESVSRCATALISMSGGLLENILSGSLLTNIPSSWVRSKSCPGPIYISATRTKPTIGASGSSLSSSTDLVLSAVERHGSPIQRKGINRPLRPQRRLAEREAGQYIESAESERPVSKAAPLSTTGNAGEIGSPPVGDSPSFTKTFSIRSKKKRQGFRRFAYQCIKFEERLSRDLHATRVLAALLFRYVSRGEIGTLEKILASKETSPDAGISSSGRQKSNP